MTYAETCDYLFTLPRFDHQGAAAYKPGLERMHTLLAAVGNPQEEFGSVHVAGTNGKGSTASMLAAISTASGRRTGLHTSPHLFDFAERMRIDGHPAPHDWIATATERLRPLIAEVKPSFFEASVALSFLYFAEQEVDLAVIEVGLGGRLDATNVLRPKLCLITSIGLDHTELLGGTLPEIAREKAGIVKPGVPVLTAARQPDVLDVFRAVAEAQGSALQILDEVVESDVVEAAWDGLRLRVRTPAGRYDDLKVGLPGLHQRDNALLALLAAETLYGREPGFRGAVARGLKDVRMLSGLRGRCDVLRLEPLVVADVAHNADGLAVALRCTESIRSNKRGPLYVVFGVMKDKAVAVMVHTLKLAGARVMPVTPATPRGLARPHLQALLHAHQVPVIEEVDDVAEGLQWFSKHAHPGDALLVTGSHYIVADIPAAWRRDGPLLSG